MEHISKTMPLKINETRLILIRYTEARFYVKKAVEESNQIELPRRLCSVSKRRL